MDPRLKFVNWGGPIFWTVLTITVTGLAVGALFTHQDWPVIAAVLLCVVVASIGAAATYNIKKALDNKPSYVLRGPVAVWTNGIPVEGDQLEDAIESIHRVLLQLVLPMDSIELQKIGMDALLRAYRVGTDVASSNDLQSILAKLYNDAIEYALDGVRVTFTKEPISVGGTKTAGAQVGNVVTVQWKGSIRSSAFIHEMVHLIDEKLNQIDHNWKPDYAHQKDFLWNKLEAGADADFKELGP
jgi:hypothetical protein